MMEVNPLSARIFTVFGHLLEDRVLHKEAWFTKLLGTHLSIQVHKKVKFSWRDNSPLALKGLTKHLIVYEKYHEQDGHKGFLKNRKIFLDFVILNSLLHFVIFITHLPDYSYSL